MTDIHTGGQRKLRVERNFYPCAESLEEGKEKGREPIVMLFFRWKERADRLGTLPAERARRMIFQPGIDAMEMETVVARRKHPELISRGDPAQTHRTVGVEVVTMFFNLGSSTTGKKRIPEPFGACPKRAYKQRGDQEAEHEVKHLASANFCS